MKYLKSINELFGFSAKEKEDKQRKIDIENLKDELLKYNWGRLFAQPGSNSWDKEHLNKLTNIRLDQAKNELPLLHKLLPYFLKMNERMPQVTCYLNIGNEKIKGIIPSQFEFLLGPTRELLNDDDTKKIALQHITSKL